jgi:hypothetical protein
MSNNLQPTELRLADYALDNSKVISPFIENQFPGIYREQGRELIELVKSYYRFLEKSDNQAIYNARRIYEYRNIDSTLESMLIFFKNKFLNGLFFDKDTQFIVKNIMDLYRRKGSKEGIELFFQMFFESEVEIYYPSEDIFKPSQSKWLVGNFLQLFPVTDITIFGDMTNRKIFGDKTNAEAFVDTIYFLNIDQSIIPIIFISGLKGKFAGFDNIYSNDPIKVYGTIYGSLDSVNVEQENISTFTSGNKIGDFVSIMSSEGGFNGKGRITSVTEQLSGEISFRVEDAGYGYTLSSNTNLISDTEIIISEQLLFITDMNRDLFVLEERIRQTNSHGVEVVGIVIGQNNESVGVFIDKTAVGYDPDTYIFETGYDIQTVDRDTNITRSVLFSSVFNESSTFQVGTLKNTETVTIITDLIEDFLSVNLDELNYSTANTATAQMSGTIINSIEPNLSTPLNEAFVPSEFEIGEINTIVGINPGFGYENDVFVLMRETLFKRFGLKNQILRINPIGISIFEGDTILQEKDILDFEGNPVTQLVKGLVVKIEGNDIYVKQLTFESFDLEFPIYKSTSPSIEIDILAQSRDITSRQLGLNAIVRGAAEFSAGKIKEIDVIDSGFGYREGESIYFINTDKKQAIDPELEKFKALEIQFEELEDIFGYSDLADVSLKRWNLNSIASALLAGGQGLQPQRDLFVNTILTSTSKALGDVDQNGIFAFEDYTGFLAYVSNLQNSTWREDNSALTEYIELVMLPYMEENYTIYSVYGNFTEEDFEANKTLQTFLVNQNIQQSIAVLEAQLAKINEVGDGFGIANARGQGTTEGRWTSFESHINQEKKIQDSFFYQDYSYEIQIDTSPSVFETTYKEIAHPAGMKFFSKFAKIDIINNENRILSFIEEIEV